MRQRRIQTAFFGGLLVLVTLAFLGLVHDFLQPVFWAAVLATLFQPVHQWWLARTGERPSFASVGSLLTIVVIVILPLFFVGLAVAREATSVYERIAAGDVNLQSLVDRVETFLPVARDYLEPLGVDPVGLQERLSNAAVSLSRTLASQVWAVGQNALRFSVQFSLMLYLLFFFLRDGEALLDAIVAVLPLGDARERALLAKFAEVSRATIKGTIVVGVVQGSLGGTIFWLLGIEAAVLWGVVMTLLSLLPAVGAAIVWAPAAIIFIATGAWVKGLLLLGFGTLIIGLADNVLRPILVGRDTKMPDYLILLSTLGGLALFGVSGFVIGPVIAALFLTVWQMFGREFATDPSHDVPDATPVPHDASDAGTPAEPSDAGAQRENVADGDVETDLSST